MSDEELGIGVERLITCSACRKQLNDPMRLPCSHVFCKSCLHQVNKAGRLECPSCRTVHAVKDGDLDRTFKSSPLAEFWVNVYNDHYDQIRADDDVEADESLGVCAACLPPAGSKAAKKADADKVTPTANVKLAKCFHCDQKICISCRTKHYDQQRQQAIIVADEYQTNTGKISILCEKINEFRTKKLVDYEKIKLDVAARKQELIKALEDEEKALLDKIDEEVVLEKTRITSSENDAKRLASSREAIKVVKQRIANETSNKKLNAICKDLLNTHEEWKGIFEGESNRNDPTKEMRINFVESKNKSELIGTIDTKKDNLKLKAAKMPKSKSSNSDGNQKSSLCTIS